MVSVTNLRMVPVGVGRIRLLWTPVPRATAYKLVIINTQGKDLLHVWIILIEEESSFTRSEKDLVKEKGGRSHFSSWRWNIEESDNNNNKII